MNNKKMNSKRLERILQRNNRLAEGITADNHSDVSQILGLTLELSKKSSGGNITRHYDFTSGVDNVTYKTWYFVEGGKIYKGFLDPSASVMEPAKSDDTEVPEKEFLEWVQQDTSRVVDFVRCAQKYIRDAPAYMKSMRADNRERKEAMMRYP